MCKQTRRADKVESDQSHTECNQAAGNSQQTFKATVKRLPSLKQLSGPVASAQLPLTASQERRNKK